MLPSLLYLLFFFFGSLGFFYGVAWLLFKVLGIKLNALSVFLKLFILLQTGAILSVVFLSLGVAGMNSSMPLLLIPLLFAFGYYKRDKSIDTQVEQGVAAYNRASFIAIGSIALVSVLYWWGALTHFGDGFYFPFWDHLFYARILEIFDTQGLEARRLLALYEENYKLVLPYHYFELWLSLWYAKVFRVTHIVAYEVFANGFLTFSLGLLVLEYVKSYLHTFSKWAVLLALPALFYLGFNWNFYKLLGVKLPFEITEPYFISFVHYPKQLPVYVFIGFAIILFKYKKDFWAVCALLFAGLVYNVAMPAILGMLALWGLYKLLKFRSLKPLLSFLFLGLATLASVGFFYSVLHKNEEVGEVSSFFLKQITPSIFVKGTIIYIIAYSMLFIDVIVLLLLIWRKSLLLKFFNSHRYWLWPVLLMAVGHIVNYCFFGYLECFQFFFIPSGPVFFFGTLSVWLFLLSNLSKSALRGFSLGLSVFIALAFCNFYFFTQAYSYPTIKVNTTFYKGVVDRFKALELNPLGAFMDTTISEQPVSELRYIGNHFSMIDSKYLTASLTSINDWNAGLKKNKALEGFASQDPFTRFYLQRNFSSVQEGQLAFIKEKKIDYVVINRALPSSVYQHLSGAFIEQFVDLENNYLIVILDRTKLP